MLFLSSGGICHAGDALPWVRGEMRGVSIGETVGLLLRNGALRVFLRSKRTGSRVCAGVLCTGLVGELLWATDLYDVGDSVRLLRKTLPRELTEIDQAGEAMQLPADQPGTVMIQATAGTDQFLPFLCTILVC